MEILCSVHKTPLVTGRCDACFDDNVRNYEEHFKGMNVTLSIPSRPNKVLVDGKLVAYYHETEYVECSVPAQLQDEIEQFIEKRVAEFEQQCDCSICQEQRAELAVR